DNGGGTLQIHSIGLLHVTEPVNGGNVTLQGSDVLVDATVTASGALVMTATGGNVTINADTSGASVTYTADESAANNDNIEVYADVIATGGNILLQAGDSIIIDPTLGAFNR